jgi:DNA-binding GntR family transcriptional regulator
VSPQIERPLPPYLQITTHYRDLIRRGELKNGDRLPSARKLVDEWGVSHATAAKVLATLRAEGLVRTSTGGAGGTVVDVEGAGRSPRDHITAIRRWGKIYPEGEHARILTAELVVASDEVAAALGIEPGTQAIRRHRVTYAGDVPMSASTSWFAAELAAVAPDLLRTERIKQGTPGYIEQQTGRRVKLGRDQFTATLADEVVAADLDIEVGEPVLAGRNWFRDQDGEVLEFGQYVSRASRWQTYEYELSSPRQDPCTAEGQARKAPAPPLLSGLITSCIDDVIERDYRGAGVGVI